MLKKFINKLILKNQLKIWIIIVITSLALVSFLSLSKANNFLDNEINQVGSKYGGYDFSFNFNDKLSDDKLNQLKDKYNFSYEKKSYKIINQLNEVKNDEYKTGDTFELFSNRESKYNNSFILSGRNIQNDNEILVTNDFLQNKKIKLGSNYSINNKQYVIVGTFGSISNQVGYLRNFSSKYQDKYAIVVSENNYNNIDGIKSDKVFAKFNQNLSYSKRVELENKIRSDELVQYSERINLYNKKNEKVEVNLDKYCGDVDELNQLSKVELTEQQFNDIKNNIKLGNENKCNRGGIDLSILGDYNISSSLLNQYTGALAKLDTKWISVVNSNSGTTYKARGFVDLIKFDINRNIYDWDADTSNLKQYFNFVKDRTKDFSIGNGISRKIPNFVYEYSQFSTHGNEYLKAILNNDFNFFNRAIEDIRNKVISWSNLVKDDDYINSGMQFVADARRDAGIDINDPNTSFLGSDCTNPDAAMQQFMAYLNVKQCNSLFKLAIEVAKKIIFDASPDAKTKYYSGKSELVEDFNINIEEIKPELEELTNVSKRIYKEKNDFENNKKTSDNAKKGTKLIDFKYKVQNGFEDKKYTSLDTLFDVNDTYNSSAYVNQISYQRTFAYALISVLTILMIILTFIIVSKIINDSRKEIGILQTYGYSSKLIAMNFIKLPIFALIISFIISYFLSDYVYMMIKNFIFSRLFIFKFDDLINNTQNIIVSFVATTIFVIGWFYYSINSKLKVKTINLLNGLTNTNIKLPKWNIKSRQLKLSINTFFWNKDKSFIVFIIGFVISILFSFVLFNLASTYLNFTNVANELKTPYIDVKNNSFESINKDNDITFESGYINGLYDKNQNQKKASADISSGSQKVVNIIGSQANSKNFVASDISELNDGIKITKKFSDEYNINVGDYMSLNTRDGIIKFRISKVSNEIQSIYFYSSKSYIDSILNKVGKANAVLTSSARYSDKTEYIYSTESAKKDIISNVSKTLNIFIILLVVSIIIILPLFIFIVSLIISDEISIIASLKAIGFNLGKIRRLMINNYFYIFAIGVLSALILNSFLILPNISPVLFKYLGRDILFINSAYSWIATLFAIFITYWLIVFISSKKINVYNTASILNVDSSSSTKLHFEDVKNYIKKVFRVSFDLDKPKNEFRYRDIKHFNKEEKKSLKKRMFKYIWPLFIAGIGSNTIQFFIAGINVATATVLKDSALILLIVATISALVNEIKFFQNLTDSALTFFIGFWKNNDEKNYIQILTLWLQQSILISIIYILLYYFLILPILPVFFDEYMSSIISASIIVIILTDILSIFDKMFSNILNVNEDTRYRIIVDPLTKIVSVLSSLFIFANSTYISKNLGVYFIITGLTPYLVLMPLTIYTLWFKKYRTIVFKTVKNIFNVDTKLYILIIKTSMPRFRLAVTHVITQAAQTFTTLKVAAFFSPNFAYLKNVATIVSGQFSLIGQSTYNLITDTTQIFMQKALSESKFLYALKLSKIYINVGIFSAIVEGLAAIIVPFIIISIYKIHFSGLELVLFYVWITTTVINIISKLFEAIWIQSVPYGAEFKFMHLTDVYNEIIATFGGVLLALTPVSYIIVPIYSSLVVMTRSWLLYIRCLSGRWLFNPLSLHTVEHKKITPESQCKEIFDKHKKRKGLI